MQNHLLTIVTVTKNCASTLANTLTSVRQIKSSSIEYIIIDGASTDETLAIVRSFEDLADVIVSEPDSGIYNAMNKGVRLASGRYVLFINGDDVLVADGFPAVMEAMACGGDEIICATTVVGDIVSPIETLVAQPWRLPFFNSIPHPSSFVRRDLLLRSPFREDLRIVSDYDFFLQACLARKRFHVLPVVTALHQRGGASGDVQRSQAEIKRVRRDRLGWRYHLVDSVAGLYRLCKHLVYGRTA